MFQLLTIFALCFAHVFGVQSLYTFCAGTFPYLSAFIISCSGTAYYQNSCTNADFGIQSLTAVTYSVWTGTTTSVLTSTSVRVLTTLRFDKGYQSNNANGCQINLGPGYATATYSLTTFYLTSLIPRTTVTLSTSVTETISATVTSSIVNTVTDSVCVGDNGVITRYTTGPVPGTSTITTCSSA